MATAALAPARRAIIEIAKFVGGAAARI
jgi:hypothetical protein